MIMNWNIVVAEMAGASVVVTLGCLIWSKVKIYRLPVAGVLFRPRAEDFRIFRPEEQMKRLILEEIQKQDADTFNLAGMFIVPVEFLQLGGSLKQTYLDQLDALLKAEGFSLSQPDDEMTEKTKKPLWIRAHALDYYLSVANSQTAGITQEMRESARRLMFIWMRCATTGMKIEQGQDYNFSDPKHRRWVAKRIINYVAFLLWQADKPHGLLAIDPLAIEETYPEFADDAPFTDEECEAAVTQVIKLDAA